ncbi:UNVERIFIED_CONTAM: hypothetical protein FKN15_007259 [Acipenser sinensis]
MVSPSNSSLSHFKMIQYEIKLVKMFKGFEKFKDIQYVYTPPYSSLCGVKLEANNKAQYLLSENECLWTDWLTDKSLNGHQAKHFACIKRTDGSCSWYRGGSPPEKEFMDISDP